MTLSELSDVELLVDQIVPEAHGVVSLTLVSPAGGLVPRWAPGAHIDVLISPDLERQYSLCGDPDDEKSLRIAVLREPESRGGSQWVHERLNAGDVIRVRGPRNNFELQEADEYLFIAGGIGITPILPMIAACEERQVPWRMIYGGRQLDSMAFTGDLERYGDRIRIWPQDRFGLIDIAGFLGAPRTGAAIYCCGPGPLLDAVEVAAETWPAGSLHMERFRPKAGVLDDPGQPFDVIVESTGIQVHVRSGQSIVDACKLAGVHIPTSCGEGTCGTCETGLLEGTADHRDSFLTPLEKESGEVIMPCCSRAKTPSLVLDL
ncbi:ferredoxin [Mycolicibacterium murale]|uniref:Ferredoxin n=2 Tax=Mycolicibacterium murale TaxID=182220 RepID=A0A7I9WM24_9MYCO|nr:oxidoreductase [Mycolicibacterium murale]GFG58781.1 ferredoxin [Mycolicibacterium murale]